MVLADSYRSDVGVLHRESNIVKVAKARWSNTLLIAPFHSNFNSQTYVRLLSKYIGSPLLLSL